MDLFHTITQEIENVLSCQWLTDFKDSKLGSRTNTPGPSTPRRTSPAPASRNSSTSSSSSDSSILSRTESISEMSTGTRKMDKPQTMDTEAGGEQTQYEAIDTFSKPHEKQSGQLGGSVPDSGTTTDTSGVDADRAQKTTENVRYGQNVSESGMGGKTTTSGGQAHEEGGYGGMEADKNLEAGEGKNPRSEQQYSKGRGVHDYNIGA